MKIGVLSDSHDHVAMLTKALDILVKKHKVEMLVHAGDYVAPFALKALLKRDIPFVGVLGNNDGERAGLMALAGDRLHAGQYIYTCEQTRILVVHDRTKIHGTDMIRKEGIQVFIHGHTHEPEMAETNGCLYLNPGECCGVLYGNATCALLELPSRTVQLITIS